MATAARDLSAADTAQAQVDAYLEANQRKSLLRFLTCGSVDDGKSTLIGRLLYDSKMLFEDQLATLENDSKRSGTQGEGLDFALLVDGLAAEREQGITIDVAYRFFSTDKRKFIVADTPGHEQYTRNMVTGASTADLAIILVDARKGILTQTRRHSFLVNLLGIRNLVLAINKMDLVGYSQSRFDEIVEDYRAFAREAGIGDFTAIPLSGLQGDNVTARTEAMPWYEGPPLLEHLETVPPSARIETPGFRMAVQWVNRPNSAFRGYAGTITSGTMRPGDAVRILPSGRESTIDSIVSFGGDLDVAVAGQSITVTLTDEVDCSRGNIIASPSAPLETVDSLTATLVWMAEEALVPGRSYLLKIGAQTVSASVNHVQEVIDVDTLARSPGRTMRLNDIALCQLNLDRVIAAIPYAEDRQLGGFILIDKLSHATVAAGMIQSFPRTARRGQSEGTEDENGRILWIAGPSAAERAAFAHEAQHKLDSLGRPSFVLDAAVLRAGLSDDLGETAADDAENVRRAREVAKLMSRAGVHVLVTIDTPSDEAHPGKRVDATSFDQGSADEWII